MFNRIQLESLKQSLRDGVPSRHDGLPLQARHTPLEEEGVILYEEPMAATQIHGPLAIFGRPEIRSCLQGLPPITASVPIKRIRLFRETQVIGWRTILSGDGLFSTARPYLEGGLCKFTDTNNDGFLIHGQKLVYAGAPNIDRIRITGMALFITALEAGNYGSFLFRILPKLLLAKAAGLKPDWIIIPDQSRFVFEALMLAGFDCARVVTIRQCIGLNFESLVLIDDFDAEGTLCDLTRERIRAMRARSAASPSKLFVSRRIQAQCRPNYRPMLNEASVEQALAGKGFTLVHPELLSLSEQISLFSTARCLVGASGSGMLNAIFSDDGLRVLDIESFTYTVRQHAKIYGSCGHRYAFAFGSLVGDEESKRQPVTCPWRVDVADVLAGIDALEKA